MDGLLVVDKPPGLTSHDVVDRLRRRLPGHRIGHGGTLDPMATGVLMILVGRATKHAGVLLGLDKAYEATITLGVVTETHDRDGRLLERRPVPLLTLAQVEEAARAFLGEIEQVVPAYSAVRFGGRRGYELARAGLPVPEKRRAVSITTLEVGEVSGDQVRVRVTCSKGTYIRVLAHDLGAALGCGGCLSALRRTRVGPWTLAEAHPLRELDTMGSEDIARLLQPVSILNAQHK